MPEAKQYARLFKTGQYGRLYIVSGEHARGRTFHIFVLPEGERAIENGPNNGCINKDAVEVHGIISGNPGWNEEYGWLHKGKWQDDFEVMVEQRENEIAKENQISTASEEDKIIKENERVKRLLAAY